MRESIARISPRRIAGIATIIITIVAAGLHLLFGLHAGALWRDEVNSLEIATMATLSEMWTSLGFDSFPALFFLLLRTFAGASAAASDASLRIFGAAIGLLILGVIWLNARWLRLVFPVISIALIGLNPMVIRYGDSIRAYGLGILLVLLCLGAMWRLVESFTPARAALALMTALLSVHCLYYNAFLLLAICSGAAAVTLIRRRNLKQTALVLGIGAAAALSLLVYVPTIRRVDATNFFWKVDFSATLLWTKLAETLGSPEAMGAWLWVAFFFCAIGVGVWAMVRTSPAGEDASQKDQLLFALISLLVGTIAYISFLFHLSYLTQPWYYVVLVAFAATCLETIVASVGGSARALLLRAAFAVVFTGLIAYPASLAVEVRQTNVDRIAAALESSATKDDLILINTWNYGIPFRRYYHGAATQITMPPMADLRSHRMDLVKQQMMAPAPMAPVLAKIEETLRAGHTVWLIGGLRLPPPGSLPLMVAPARDGVGGWTGGDFYRAWSEQVGFVLQNHAGSVVRVRVPLNQAVSTYENLALSAIQGWREAGRNVSEDSGAPSRDTGS